MYNVERCSEFSGDPDTSWLARVVDLVWAFLKSNRRYVRRELPSWIVVMWACVVCYCFLVKSCKSCGFVKWLMVVHEIRNEFKNSWRREGLK